MKRISTSTRAISLFGLGKDGFKKGDLANGIKPTDLEADWFNQIQEEVASLIEAAGLALDGNVKTQLLQAVRRMSGGYVRTVTAGHTVLTADDAGIVLVNAAAGAVTIALPLASKLKSLPFTFRRVDTTANSVTIAVAGTGANVIDGSASDFTLLGRGNVCKIASDGAAAWITINGPFSSLKAANGYQEIPSGFIFQWGSGVVGVTSSTYSINTTFPIEFPNDCFSIAVSHGVNVPDLDISPRYRTNQESFQCGIPTKTGFEASLNVLTSTTDSRAYRWIAIGH